MSSTSTSWAEDALTAATALTTTAQDVTITGDLTVTGGNLIFGNGEYLANTADDIFAIICGNDTSGQVRISSGGNTEFRITSAGDPSDSKLTLFEGSNLRWSIGNDGDDADKLKIDTTSPVGGATKLTLDTSGNLTVAGTITGGTQPDWTVENKTGTTRTVDCDSTSAANVAERLGQLVNDLITIGILT